MARPRVHSDEQLLSRIGDGLSSSSWTLTDAARAADVHPATLIKRFGSRQGVLEALSRRWVEATPTSPCDAGGKAELLDWLEHNAPRRDRPARALAGLGMLLEDLQDDALSALLRQGWARQRQYLAALISEASERGQLTRAPGPDMAADLLLTLIHGAQLQAAAERGNTEVAERDEPWLTLVKEWE